MTKLFPKRGSNPNSHGNNRKSPETRLVEHKISLLPEHWELAHQLGNGKRSTGVRKLVRLAIAMLDSGNALAKKLLQRKVMLVKENGYIVDQDKIDKFLQLSEVQQIRTFLARELDHKNSTQRKFAESLLLKLKPEQIPLFGLIFSEDEGTKQHLAYIVSCADNEDLLSEYAFLESCFGSPPYKDAIERGLTEQEIEGYQQTWREMGIDPSKVRWESGSKS